MLAAARFRTKTLALRVFVTLCSLCSLALFGCEAAVSPPLAAGLDSEDAELADYLADLHRSAAEFADSAPLRGRLGMAYDANGFLDAAAATYAQAEALDREAFDWPYLRAFAVASGGDLEGAVLAVEDAIGIDGAYGPAWLQLGTWLLDLDRVAEAGAAFEQALGLDGGVAATLAAQAGLARLRLRQDRTDEAVAILESLLAQYDHPQLHRLAGLAYRAAGRPAEASDAARRGRDAPPLEWPDERREATEAHIRGFHGRLGLAETHLKRGDAHRAAAMLEALRESRPEDRTLINNLSIAYQRTGRPEQAAEVLRAGLASHPDYALFHFNLGSLAEDAGRPAAAIEHFGQAAALDPALAAAHERRAMLFMAQGQAEAARAALEALVPLGGAAAAFHHAAMIAGAGGRWRSAIELLQRAVELAPGFATAHVFLGRALAESGDFEAARGALARAEALDTHSDDVEAALGRLAALEAGAP